MIGDSYDKIPVFPWWGTKSSTCWSHVGFWSTTTQKYKFAENVLESDKSRGSREDEASKKNICLDGRQRAKFTWWKIPRLKKKPKKRLSRQLLYLHFGLNKFSAGALVHKFYWNTFTPFQAWDGSDYSAATLLNCLDTDLKQIASVSLSSIIFSPRLNNFKH